MSVVRDIPKTDPFWIAFWDYVEKVWNLAIKRDPSQYNYWRMKARERMGKFKVVASEGQNVLSED